MYQPVQFTILVVIPVMILKTSILSFLFFIIPANHPCHQSLKKIQTCLGTIFHLNKPSSLQRSERKPKFGFVNFKQSHIVFVGSCQMYVVDDIVVILKFAFIFTNLTQKILNISISLLFTKPLSFIIESVKTYCRDSLTY